MAERDVTSPDRRRGIWRAARLGWPLLFGLGLWLFRDASILALAPHDPETGRARGCYTAIEEWLGLLEPSSWIRPAELIVGILAMLVPLVWLAMLARARRSRR